VCRQCTLHGISILQHNLHGHAICSIMNGSLILVPGDGFMVAKSQKGYGFRVKTSKAMMEQWFHYHRSDLFKGGSVSLCVCINTHEDHFQ